MNRLLVQFFFTFRSRGVKMTKRFKLNSLLILIALITINSCAFKIGGTTNERLEYYFQRWADKQIFSGSVLVAKNGEVLLSKGYGYSNLEKDAVCTNKTKFYIGSMSKQFTATAIMILKQQGKLSLTDPITRYFPEYAQAKDVTIHHLLSMSSGIYDYSSYLINADSYKNYTQSEFLSVQFTKPNVYSAGEKFTYNNSNFYLLAVIVEKVSGVNFHQFLKDNIFDVVGMTDTFSVSDDSQISDVATGYFKTPNGFQYKKEFHWSLMYGCGGVISTVEDIYKWDRALYTESVLTNESKNLMFTIQTPNNSAIFTTYKWNYGYGWMIDNEYVAAGKTHRLIHHGGNTFAHSSLFCRFVDEDTTIILLTNIGANLSIGFLMQDVSNMIFE